MTTALSPLHHTLPASTSTASRTSPGTGLKAITRAQERRPALAGDLLTAAQRLRLLRERDQRAAIAGHQQVLVAVYALAKPDAGGDVEHRVTEALAAANRQGWRVAFRAVDVTGDLAPALRPQLARVRAAVAAGQVAGLVSASRVDISSDDGLYTDELTWLRSRGGFLGLARNEAAL